jgi:hypothetical protein
MSISCYIADLLGTGARYVAPTADLPKPETPSSDWHAMAGTWCKIDDILAGADRVRSSGSSGSVAGPHVPYANLRNLNRGRYISGESKYLPRYSEESGEEYVRRLAAAPWRPEYADALNSLSKPFAKPVTLQGEVSAIVCQPKHSCIQIANDAASYGPDGVVGAFKARSGCT